ncbi:MAG: hypothetical protein HY286_04720 [Planctomycetes bacterium]|nr:hypothetical protein [Planctomycetota bacterium]
MTNASPQAADASAPKRSNARLAITIILFLIVGVIVAGVRNVPGGEVGVTVNNITRDVALEDRVGLHFTIPYITTFYTIDRKTRLLDMLSNATIPAGAVERQPDDSLSIKASEGDTVRIDVRVQYQIIPEKAVEVLRSSGVEVLELMKSEPTKAGTSEKWRRFEHKWIWPVVRGVLAERFNELTREAMNDGPKRVEKAEAAVADANLLLKDKFGIEIKLITVENPTSYAEYERIVRQRKDIDQQVLAIIEEQKQEKEARIRQTKTEEENNDKELSALNALHERLLSEAEARKESTINQATAKASKEKAEADKKLSTDLADAANIRKKGEAEAEGLKKLALGLSGPKGTAVIAAELAKQLKTITINASPFVYNALVQPYLMQQGGNIIPNPTIRIDAPQSPNNQPAGTTSK